jgi:signal transduction histidine kinase
MLRANGEALDLRVTATPLTIGKEDFTLFSAVDIGHEKRRRALERIFFHDVLNTATGILGWAEMLNTARPEELPEFQSTIHNLTSRLIDEVHNQQTLSAAESKQLVVRPGPIASLDLLQRLTSSYSKHPVARQRAILIAPDTEQVCLTSDEGLLLRVLGNMLKNALEACQPGETVTLGCRRIGDSLDFWVHNPNPMPEEVQLQIFQRSFSTKGAGRGLGAYSMRLLGEQYLQSKVYFTSDPHGTTFNLRCPISLSLP